MDSECGWFLCSEPADPDRPLDTPHGVQFLCCEEHRTLLFYAMPEGWRQDQLASPDVRAAVTILRRDLGVGAQLN